MSQYAFYGLALFVQFFILALSGAWSKGRTTAESIAFGLAGGVALILAYYAGRASQ